MRIGILGGTFDPVHWGHLIIAEESRDLLGLDQILFIPAKIPPHKIGHTISSEEHRFDMLKQAVKSHEFFHASDMEFKRNGLSYTVETLKLVQKVYPSAERFFLMGQDSFLEIETWYNYQELFDLCRLVVIRRPGIPPVKSELFSPIVRNMFSKDVVTIDDTLEVDSAEILGDWRICMLMIAGMQISASEIRKRRHLGRTIRYLVPDCVREYIELNNLYKPENAE